MFLFLQKDATVCTRLECEYPGFEGFCRATAPAAEGSPCGDGLVRLELLFLIYYTKCGAVIYNDALLIIKKLLLTIISLLIYYI